jgi:hypothetical protein
MIFADRKIQSGSHEHEDIRRIVKANIAIAPAVPKPLRVA